MTKKRVIVVSTICLVAIFIVFLTVFNNMFYYNGKCWTIPDYDAEKSYWSAYVENENGEYEEIVYELRSYDTELDLVIPYIQSKYVKKFNKWVVLDGMNTNGEWLYVEGVTVDFKKNDDTLTIVVTDDETGEIIRQQNFSRTEKPLIGTISGIPGAVS